MFGVVKSWRISQKLHMLQRPKIHHLKALNVDKIILEGQIHSTIRDSSGALSVFFRKKGRGKSLTMPRPCPSGLLLSTA